MNTKENTRAFLDGLMRRFVDNYTNEEIIASLADALEAKMKRSRGRCRLENAVTLDALRLAHSHALHAAQS